MTLTREATPYPHWRYTHPTSGDSLRLVPERGGLVTGWHSGGREWLYHDEARLADPAPWCASNPGVAPGAPFSAAMAASPSRRGRVASSSAVTGR